MRRYNGNTGRYEYVPDNPRRPAPSHRPHSGERGTPRNHGEPPKQERSSPPVQQSPHSSGDVLGGLQKTLAELFSRGLEKEDLLLFAVLFLMYQETKDKELLIIMGGMFLL